MLFTLSKEVTKRIMKTKGKKLWPNNNLRVSSFNNNCQKNKRTLQRNWDINPKTTRLALASEFTVLHSIKRL